jgi:hypothetical protein
MSPGRLEEPGGLDCGLANRLAVTTRVEKSEAKNYWSSGQGGGPGGPARDGRRRGSRRLGWGATCLPAEGALCALLPFHAAGWRESESGRALADYVEAAFEG